MPLPAVRGANQQRELNMTDTAEKQRIYISGPMTGKPDHNYPAFHETAERFRKAGWDVANPAENFGGRTDLPLEAYLREDISLLAYCNAVAMLPGWRDSQGATLEYLIACKLGLDVYDAWTMEPMADRPEAFYSIGQELSTESILDTAKRITATDRQEDYGHPSVDFERTAAMWTGILSDRLVPDACIRAMDIPLCMIAVKLARQVHRHKRDNLVDIAGYARTAAMVAGDE